MADIKTEQQIDRIAEEWLSRILYDICTEEFPSDEYDEWISEQYEYYIRAFKGQFRKALKDVEGEKYGKHENRN